VHATGTHRSRNLSDSSANIQPRIVPGPAVLTRQGIPDFPICGQSGPRFPFPGRIMSGKRGISRFPFPAESGIRNSLSVNFPAKSGIGGTRPRPGNRDPARRIGTPIPVPGRIGNRGSTPCQCFPAKSGIGDFLPVSRQKTGLGIGGSDSRFPSDVRASTAASTAVDLEYTSSAASVMPVRSQAACGSYSGSKRGSSSMLRLLRVTSINCSGLRLGTYSAASIMPVLSLAACGSYS
jgi:hypothetical protein